MAVKELKSLQPAYLGSRLDPQPFLQSSRGPGRQQASGIVQLGSLREIGGAIERKGKGGGV